MRTTDSIDAWTAYWQFNALDSRSVRPVLDRQLEPVWNEITDLLPDGARILDLATGNGSVALSCAQRSRTRRNHLRIDAVDAAEIRPPAQTPEPGGHTPIVRFHDRTWLERLPFDNGQFDGVLSQFGFEYADEEKAVAEANRVLSPGGRMRLILHARNGAVWRDIHARNSRLESVLAEDGVLSLVLQLVRAQQQRDLPLFNNKLKRLADAAIAAKNLAVESPADDSAMFYSKEFLYVWMHRRKYAIDDLMTSLVAGWNQAKGTANRYGQMLRVAKTAEDIRQLCERFTAAGLSIDSVRLDCSPNTYAEIGWQLDVCKPDPARI
jgi:SAM-dependent methyltransferase